MNNGNKLYPNHSDNNHQYNNNMNTNESFKKYKDKRSQYYSLKQQMKKHYSNKLIITDGNSGISNNSFDYNNISKTMMNSTNRQSSNSDLVNASFKTVVIPNEVTDQLFYNNNNQLVNSKENNNLPVYIPLSNSQYKSKQRQLQLQSNQMNSLNEQHKQYVKGRFMHFQLQYQPYLYQSLIQNQHYEEEIKNYALSEQIRRLKEIERRESEIALRKQKKIEEDVMNTPIFVLKIKIDMSNNKPIKFILRKNDDLIITLKQFCDVHQINDILYQPLLIKILISMNDLYNFLNSNIDSNNQAYLNQIKQVYYNFLYETRQHNYSYEQKEYDNEFY